MGKRSFPHLLTRLKNKVNYQHCAILLKITQHYAHYFKVWLHSVAWNLVSFPCISSTDLAQYQIVSITNLSNSSNFMKIHPVPPAAGRASGQ